LKKNFPDVAVKEIQLNVSDEAAVNDSVAQTVKEFGRIGEVSSSSRLG
jgi:hypothetical protein